MNVQPCSSSRVLRLSMLAAALSAAMLAAPAWAAPVTCELIPEGAGPDGIWGTADDAAPAVNCGGFFLPATGSASVGEVSTTRGATAIGQFVVVEPTTIGSDSNVGTAIAFPDASVGIGYRTRVDGGRNVAVGGNSRIGGKYGDFLSVEDSVAIGSTTVVTASYATAIGSHAGTNGASSTVVGAGSFATAAGVTAMGAFSGSSIEGAVILGRSAFVNAPSSGSISLNSAPVPVAIAGTTIGERSRVSGDDGIALGGFAVVGVRNSFTMVNGGTALGAGTLVSAEGGVAVGARASVANTAANAVAIGANSVADEADTVSFGTTGNERRLTHVDDGAADFDAVNLRQLTAGDEALGQGIAAWLGGGAAFAGGAFTAPVYVIQSNNYGNVGAAFGAVDAALTDINARIVAAGGVQGERGYSAYELAVQGGYAGNEAAWLASLKGDAGPAGPQGGTGPAGQDGLGSVPQIEAIAAAGDAVTLQSAQDHADAGDAQTLASANTYTDTVAVQTLQSANTYTDDRFAAWDAQLDSIQRGIDDRFHHQDRRIDRQGAMAGAFAGMAMNTAGLAGRNRVGVGVGVQGGEQALAVGYQRAISNRASVSLGGAFSSSEKSVMGGAGFSW